MADGTAFVPFSVPDKLGNKEIDLSSDEFKVMLLLNTFSKDQDTHDYLNDVVAHEVSGTGYTAGGVVLTTSWTPTAGTNTWKFDANDVSISGTTLADVRYAVVYDNTPTTNATKPILYVWDFGADRSTSAEPFELNWNAAGILVSVVAAEA